MQTGWKVIIADKLGITRRALTMAFRMESENHQVLESGSAHEVLELLQRVDPTLLLVDLHAPGLDLVREARAQSPGLKIVVLAGYDQPSDALDALKAGADGFLVKGMFPEELMTCLRCVVDTGVVVTSRVLKAALGQVTEPSRPNIHIVDPVPLDDEIMNGLTPREREIFELMAENYSNKEIGARLHIAEQTVKAHVSRILTKMGQPNRAQAVIHGLRSTRNGSATLVTLSSTHRS
ncbi:MAG: LuxR C-terminal-related transcriptional regulator [Bacillota bacterium]